MELLFYLVLARLFIFNTKKHFFKLILYGFITIISLVGIFVVLGSLRQGDEFSIVEYSGLYVDNAFLAWVFGYFLVNFDNLALVIDQQYTNNSFSNVLGPILQFLQIIEYEAVDAYPYVGKFNLGTAFRPFVLDFGPLFGCVVFGLFWSLFLCLYTLHRRRYTKFAYLLLLSYCAFCMPITSRLEIPPYLACFAVIFLIDRFGRLQRSEQNA